jgi:hypothetical protein
MTYALERFPSWEGLGVGSIPRLSHQHSGSKKHSQMLLVFPDKAKPAVRQGRKATDLRIDD